MGFSVHLFTLTSSAPQLLCAFEPSVACTSHTLLERRSRTHGSKRRVNTTLLVKPIQQTSAAKKAVSSKHNYDSRPRLNADACTTYTDKDAGAAPLSFMFRTTTCACFLSSHLTLVVNLARGKSSRLALSQPSR